MGARSLLSLNYDRIILQSGKWKLSGKIGISPFSTSNIGKKFNFGIPLAVNILYGKKNSYLEVGVCLFYYYNDNDFNTIGINQDFSGFSIAYRYQRPNGGFFFNGGIKPNIRVYGFYNNTRFERYLDFVLPFLSLGYSF